MGDNLNGSNSQRLYYLDFLRGVLMFLGVVLHSMTVFSVGPDWRITSPEKISYARPIIDFIHTFRMPAFFIIAGFFMAMVLRKQAPFGYVKQRFVRLGVPLLFAGLALNLPMSVITSVSPNELGWSRYLGEARWLSHLWFLAVLILYTVILASVWPVISNVLKVSRISQVVIWAMLIVLAYPVFIRIGWFLDKQEVYLYILTRDNLFQYFAYFLVGIIWYQNIHFNLVRGRALLFLAITLLGYLFFRAFDHNVLKNLTEIIMCIATSFFLFSAADRFFSTPAKWKKAMAESSYTVYLLHQPLIIGLAYFILPLEINVHVKLFSIMVLTALMTWWFHFKVVERVKVLGFLINGKSLNNKRVGV